MMNHSRLCVAPWRLVETDLDIDDAGFVVTLFAVGDSYLGHRCNHLDTGPRSTVAGSQWLPRDTPISHAEWGSGSLAEGQQGRRANDRSLGF